MNVIRSSEKGQADRLDRTDLEMTAPEMDCRPGCCNSSIESTLLDPVYTPPAGTWLVWN
jgi:hypothetical protein